MDQFPNVFGITAFALLAMGCAASGDFEASPPTASVSQVDSNRVPSNSPTPSLIGDDLSCDKSEPPLVMAHGFIAAGDTWSRPVRLFARNGHCVDRYHAFDWNSIDQGAEHMTALNAFIDSVRLKHDVEQVDLVGHSAGGGLSYTFMDEPSRAKKIRKYIHIASFPTDPPSTMKTAGIQMLNLWSPDDTVVDGADIDGVDNRQMPGQDHYEVATSPESFAQIYAFLYGRDPKHLSLKPQTKSRVSGRALSLGEAVVQKKAQVRVWSLDENGQRVKTVHSTLTDEVGYWGPVDVDGGQPLEFELVPSDETPRLRYFHEPFAADDSLVYLRSFPAPGSIASLIVSQVPADGNGVSLIIFNSSRAFLADKDSLTLNGRELLTPDNSGPEQTSISLFLFDIDDDGETGGSSGLFDSFPFLTAIDAPLNERPGESIRLNYNGTKLVLPRDGAEKGGLVAVFR